MAKPIRVTMLASLICVFMALTACTPSQRSSSIANAQQPPLPEYVIVDGKSDLEPLFSDIGQRRFVLLGESTHGTHEYYHWRDLITRRLIRSKGFRFVSVEGDWEALARFNDYVNHRTPETVDVVDIMRDLDRWPQWMWGNEEFAALITWLRDYNENLDQEDRVGVYGLDMQNPQASMSAVIDWLEDYDPQMGERAEVLYQPFRSGPDGFRHYAQSLARGETRLRQNVKEVAEWLEDLQQASPRDAALFSAKMNAMAVVSAEAQHHAMVVGGPASWNVRARHMKEAFLKVAEWTGDDSRGVYWAHNTHVGDASATEMVDRGEVNIGQLLRASQGREQVYILGFATSGGRVVAGRGWGAPMQVMTIIPPRQGSLEALLAERGTDDKLWLFNADKVDPVWFEPRIHRAIGVVYNPPHEAYVGTVAARRYDALFYIHETRALTPVR